MFDPRIYTFLTLYRERNYRKTAELLSMTQPGVTQHIQYLEKLYGVRFFSYEGRSLRISREAEIFKRHLDSILTEEKAMRDEFAANRKLVLNVGATKTIGEFVLLKDVERFLRNPAHSLNFTIDNTRSLLEMLDNRQLDFAVVEGIVDKNRYSCRLFKKEKFTGICSKKHRFAGRSVQLEEAFGETLLLREKGSGTRYILEQALNDRGLSLDNFRRTVSLSNFSVIMELLSRNECITFAYKPIADQRENLSTFQVEGMDLEGEFNFVSCNQGIADEKIRLFFCR